VPGLSVVVSRVGATLVEVPSAARFVRTKEMVTGTSWSLGNPPCALKALSRSCCAGGTVVGTGLSTRSLGKGMFPATGSNTAVTTEEGAGFWGMFPGSPQAAASERTRSRRSRLEGIMGR